MKPVQIKQYGIGLLVAGVLGTGAYVLKQNQHGGASNPLAMAHGSTKPASETTQADTIHYPPDEWEAAGLRVAEVTLQPMLEEMN